MTPDLEAALAGLPAPLTAAEVRGWLAGRDPRQHPLLAVLECLARALDRGETGRPVIWLGVQAWDQLADLMAVAGRPDLARLVDLRREPRLHPRDIVGAPSLDRLFLTWRPRP